MQLFSHGKHGSRARAPNDDVGQHGGLTRINAKSCGLGLQRVTLILNIHTRHVMVKNKVSADQYHVTISRAQV